VDIFEQIKNKKTRESSKVNLLVLSQGLTHKKILFGTL